MLTSMPVSREEAEAVIDQFAPAADVNVFYRPSNPNFCFLLGKTSLLGLLMIGVGFLLLIFGGGLALVTLLCGGTRDVGNLHASYALQREPSLAVAAMTETGARPDTNRHASHADTVHVDVVDAELIRN
jgi:hypothetical protein